MTFFNLPLILILTTLTQSLPAQCAERALPYFEAADLSPYWESEQKADQNGKPFVRATVSSFKVIDQNGKPVTEKNLAGKITLINFFFTACGTACPTMMSFLQKLQSKMPDDKVSKNVQLYSFSVTPNYDTPARLTQYAKKRNMDLSNWFLLTGSAKEIFRIAKTILKADRSIDAKKNDASFIHTKDIYLIDSHLQIRGIYDSSGAKMLDTLASDVAKLKLE